MIFFYLLSYLIYAILTTFKFMYFEAMLQLGMQRLPGFTINRALKRHG